MSKAKQRALEKYPLMKDDDKEGLEALKYIGMECECASVFNEAQEAKQAYFIEGYHQAEKDLELTWRDTEQILDIIDNLVDETFNAYNFSIPADKEFYQEVLKRFKDLKHVK